MSELNLKVRWYKTREFLFLCLIITTLSLTFWHVINIEQSRANHEAYVDKTNERLSGLKSLIQLQTNRIEKLIREINLTDDPWTHLARIQQIDPIVDQIFTFSKQSNQVLANTSNNPAMNTIIHQFLQNQKDELLTYLGHYCYIQKITLNESQSVGLVINVDELLNVLDQADAHEFSEFNYSDAMIKDMFYDFLRAKSKQVQKHQFENYVLWVLLVTSIFLIFIYHKINKTNDKNLIALRKALDKNKLQTQKLNFIANFDQLTRLGNRNKLYRDFKKLKANRFCLCLMDLDGFKSINDTQGHLAGDELLVRLANNIRKFKQDTPVKAYRLGGDEFVFISTNKPVMRNFIKDLDNLFEEKADINGQRFHVTASIGMVHHPEDGIGISELLSNADLAMYEAKMTGKNQLCDYQPRMKELVLKKVRLRDKIITAIRESEFINHYQPRINIRNNQVTCIEALARWHHNGKLLLPAHFIDNNESHSTHLNSICIQLLSKAFSDFKELPVDLKHIRLAINFSPNQLLNPDYLETFIDACIEAEIPTHRIEIEITENSFSGQEQQAIEVIKRLKKLGYIISLDDFGKEYSSLAYLKNLPIDVLKIDREFVKNIPQFKRDTQFITNIINFGKSLDMKVVVEGVETSEQFNELKNTCADEVQGFYISRPISFAQVIHKIMSINQKKTSCEQWAGVNSRVN